MCKNLPEFIGLRSLSESVNSSLKRRQITYLKSKKIVIKQREFGWHVVLYNLQRKLIVENSQQSKVICKIFLFNFYILSFPDRAIKGYKYLNTRKYLRNYASRTSNRTISTRIKRIRF